MTHKKAKCVSFIVAFFISFMSFHSSLSAGWLTDLTRTFKIKENKNAAEFRTFRGFQWNRFFYTEEYFISEVARKLREELPADLRLARSVLNNPICLQANTNFPELVENVLRSYTSENSNQGFIDLRTLNTCLLCINETFLLLADGALRKALEPLLDEVADNGFGKEAAAKVLQASFNVQLLLIDTFPFKTVLLPMWNNHKDSASVIFENYKLPGFWAYNLRLGTYDFYNLDLRNQGIRGLSQEERFEAERERLKDRMEKRREALTDLIQNLTEYRQWGVGCSLGAMVNSEMCCAGVRCDGSGMSQLLQNQAGRQTSNVTESYRNEAGITGEDIVAMCCANEEMRGGRRGIRSRREGSEGGNGNPFSLWGNADENCTDMFDAQKRLEEMRSQMGTTEKIGACFDKYGYHYDPFAALNAQPISGSMDPLCLYGNPAGDGEDVAPDEQPTDDAAEQMRDPTPAEKQELDKQNKEANDAMKAKESEARAAHEKKNGAVSDEKWKELWAKATSDNQSFMVTDGKVGDLFENGTTEQAATATLEDGSKVIVVDKWQAMGLEGGISNKEIMAHEKLHVGFGDSLSHRQIYRLARKIGGAGRPGIDGGGGCDDPTGAMTRAKNLFECTRAAMGLGSIFDPSLSQITSRLTLGKKPSGPIGPDPRVVYPNPEGGRGDCNAISMTSIAEKTDQVINCGDQYSGDAAQMRGLEGIGCGSGDGTNLGGSGTHPCALVDCPHEETPRVNERGQCVCSGAEGLTGAGMGGSGPSPMPGGIQVPQSSPAFQKNQNQERFQFFQR